MAASITLFFMQNVKNLSSPGAVLTQVDSCCLFCQASPRYRKILISFKYHLEHTFDVVTPLDNM